MTALVLSSCGGETRRKKRTGAPSSPSGCAPVIQKTVQIFSEFTARADARDTVEIRARVEAFLDGIHFEEGRPVKKGQLLFTLDKRKYVAALESAKAQVAKAKAELEFAMEQVTVDTAKAKVDQAKAQLGKADLDVNRLEPLAKVKAVPQQDLDNALVAQQVGRSNLDAGKANYETTVRPSEGGRGCGQGSRFGGGVRDQAGGTRCQLLHGHGSFGRPHRPEIGFGGEPRGSGRTDFAGHNFGPGSSASAFAVSETEYLALARRMGKSARKPVPIELVLADGTVHPQKGRVTVADRAVDEKTGTLTLVAEFPNPDRLIRPGQFGTGPRRDRYGGERRSDSPASCDGAAKRKGGLRRRERQQSRTPNCDPWETGLRTCSLSKRG